MPGASRTFRARLDPVRAVPAGFLRHPEDSFGEVLVAGLQDERPVDIVRHVVHAVRIRQERFQRAVPFDERVGDVYFRKIGPRATCLYSPESMLPHILFAASQSVASIPNDWLLALERGVAGSPSAVCC